MCWSCVSTREPSMRLCPLLLLSHWLSVVTLARSIYTITIGQHCKPASCQRLICAAPWVSKACCRLVFRQSLA